MDPPDAFPGENQNPVRRELQGPRPTPLKVRKDSYKIKKPPVAPPARPPHPPPPETENRQPVIIYAVSPKPIHTTVDEFMNLVQRLTGFASSSSSSPAAAQTGGDVSPAARLASIEKTSPSERVKEREKAGEVMGMVEGVEMGQFPGILSPAPATLPPIPPDFFSPAYDQNSVSVMHDLNPFMYANNMFIPSPSTLFSAPLVLSPSPSAFDLFNHFLDS